MRPARLTLLVAALGSVSASASSDFPSAIRSHLSAPRSVSCTACHQSSAGGFGTIDKDFGFALMDNGLAGGDVSTVPTSLDALEAAGTDSDGDGVGDVAELRAGTDPNVVDAAGGEGEGESTPPELQYGFGCASTSADASGVALLALIALRMGAARRRR